MDRWMDWVGTGGDGLGGDGDGDGDGDGLGGEWSGVEWWCWRVEFLGWDGMGWDGEVRGFMGSLVAVGSGMR